MVSPLKKELERRGSEAQEYAGVPPVGQYWLIVESGDQIAQLLTEKKWSFRRLAARFNVAPETLKRTVLFISDHEELVATKDWQQLENLLFGRWPDFRSMPFYRDYILPGSSVPYRKQFRDGKKVGRRVGSKNKPKTPVPNSQPVVPVPTPAPAPTPTFEGPGRGQPPVSPPSSGTPVAVPAPTAEKPKAVTPEGDGPDLDLPPAWSSQRAKELAGRRS